MSKFFMPKAQNSEAVTWLVASGVTGVALFFGAAWFSDKTSKKVEHPSLGLLSYGWGSWTGQKAHYRSGKPPIVFEIPGPKAAPGKEHCEALTRLLDDLPTKVASIRLLAIEHFRDIYDDGSDFPEVPELDPVLTSLDTSEEQFEEHWVLHQVSLSEDTDSPVTWTLEFEVSWDEEHSRAAYLSSDGEVLDYGLSCAGPDLEEDAKALRSR